MEVRRRRVPVGWDDAVGQMHRRGGRRFKADPGTADLSGEGRLVIACSVAQALGRFCMSVQMVLLPVFVLVGLTFFLLLWMVTARTKAVKARETSLKDDCGGQPKYPTRAAQIGNCSQQPVRSTPAVLFPDRAGAAAASGRSLHRADVLGVRGDAICPCRHFRHARTTSSSAAWRWFAGVLVLLAMWIYFALKLLLLIIFV